MSEVSEGTSEPGSLARHGLDGKDEVSKEEVHLSFLIRPAAVVRGG